MRNLNYFHFERNRYFYGKLLSVDDFEAEQRYMNDKRRILNRFMNGMGVVCGLNVVGVDEETISVETGLALDDAGREIVVEKPVLKKLGMIDGFADYQEDDEANNNLYLYIEYQEKAQEAVHSIAASHDSNEEFNKYQEGYHLYLSSVKPDGKQTVRGIFEENTVLYENHGIRITQTVPRYVSPEQEFELEVMVEKINQSKPVCFSYDLECIGVEGIEEQATHIAFSEEDNEQSSVYYLKKRFRALPVRKAKGALKPAVGSFLLEVGDEKQNFELRGSSNLLIAGTSPIVQMREHYYHSVMEDVMSSTGRHGICIARISVVRGGGTYLIDAIESMPFAQYIDTAPYTQAVRMMEQKQQEENARKETAAGRHNALEAEQKTQTACGTVTIYMGIGGLKGKRFYSEEIVHGLGLGAVYMTLGQEGENGENSSIMYGDQDIFEQAEQRAPVKLAARVDMTKGSFQIGIECMRDTAQQQVTVHWMAVKDDRMSQTDSEAPVMKINPDMKNMYVRESYYFEALIAGISDSRVFWSVKESDGGSIDENGMYTAPNQPGVYEIRAVSMDDPQLTASTYVVIRDKNS